MKLHPALQLTQAMIAGLPYTALRNAILTHPTMAEGLIPSFSSVPSVQQPGRASAQQVDAVAD